MPRLAVAFGQERVELAFVDGRLLQPRPAQRAAPLGDVADAVRAALEAPTDFPPLRKCLTPDDEVVVIVPPTLHQAPAIVGAVIEQIRAADVPLERITLLAPPNLGERPFDLMAALPEALRGVQFIQHDWADAKQRAYLAGTQAGRAVYLNRHLTDAGQVVVIGQLGYDPVFGYRGGLDELFPAFSDEPTWREFAQKPSATLAGTPTAPAAAEAKEVGWLLGLPFLLQVLEAPGDGVAAVFAGTADSLAGQGERRLDQQRRLKVSRTADLVVATLTGAPERQSFVEVVRAFATASRVVRPGGAVAVLSRAGGAVGPGFDHWRQAETPAAGLRLAKQAHAPDWVTLWQLALATQHARLFLFSDLPAEAVEELSITPLESPGQVQKLIEEAETTLLLPDADLGLAAAGR